MSWLIMPRCQMIPWRRKFSEIYYEAAVTAAVEKIAAEEHAEVAA